MDINLQITIISCGVSVFTTLIIQGYQYSKDKAKINKDVEELLRAYRDPLLVSADALQSRIFNIVEKMLFEKKHTPEHRMQPSGRTYAIESTLFAFSEFFGWCEILRQKMQFFRPEQLKQAKSLNYVLEEIRRTIAQDKSEFGTSLILFRYQQRAIGELMIKYDNVNSEKCSCVGINEFCNLLNNSQIINWICFFEEDINNLQKTITVNERRRLSLLHNWLIELIELLDPDHNTLTGLRNRLLLDEEIQKYFNPYYKL